MSPGRKLLRFCQKTYGRKTVGPLFRLSNLARLSHARRNLPPMSVLLEHNRRLGKAAPCSVSQLSPHQTRGLGSDMSRPQSVQWSLRTGPSSPRSILMSASSPRTTSFVDQSFHRVANKFSPAGGGDTTARNLRLARSYDHQQWAWQASRLSVVSPTSWHRPRPAPRRTPFGPYAHEGSNSTADWYLSTRPVTAYSAVNQWMPPAPQYKTTRTVDFWQ